MIHPRDIEFPSKSEPGVVHTLVTASLLNDEFCTCTGWNFRGECSHVNSWKESRCTWVGGLSTDFPGLEICPECGEPTEDF